MKNKHFAKLSAVMIAMILAVNGGFAMAEDSPSAEPPAVQEAPAQVQESAPAPVVETPVETPAPVVETPVETPAPVVTEPTAIPEPAATDPEPTQTVEPGTDETQQNEQPAAEEGAGETPAEETQEASPEEEEQAESPEEQSQDHTDDQTSASTDDAKQTKTDDSKETKEPEKEKPFTGSASVVKITAGKLYFGDTAVLKAKVAGANKVYTIRWQTRKGGAWKTITNNTKYIVNGKVLSVRLDKTDTGREYRAVLLVTEDKKINQYNSSSFVFGGITEKPKAEDEEKVEETTTEEETEEAAETEEEAEEEDEFYEENDAETEEGYTDGDDEYEEETVEEDNTAETDNTDETETTETTEETETAEENEEAETETPEQTTAETIQDISIHAVWNGGEAGIGNDITFYVVLNGYEGTDFQIQWQHSEDNANWEDIPGADKKSYTVTATEDNCRDYWRAKVTATSNE